jgi:hypothetical protein
MCRRFCLLSIIHISVMICRSDILRGDVCICPWITILNASRHLRYVCIYWVALNTWLDGVGISITAHEQAQSNRTYNNFIVQSSLYRVHCLSMLKFCFGFVIFTLQLHPLQLSLIHLTNHNSWWHTVWRNTWRGVASVKAAQYMYWTVHNVLTCDVNEHARFATSCCEKACRHSLFRKREYHEFF